MTQPIQFIIRDAENMRIYECPNYTGYIPHIGDWLKFPTMTGSACRKVVARDFEFKDQQLLSVILSV